MKELFNFNAQKQQQKMLNKMSLETTNINCHNFISSCFYKYKLNFLILFDVGICNYDSQVSLEDQHTKVDFECAVLTGACLGFHASLFLEIGRVVCVLSKIAVLFHYL